MKRIYPSRVDGWFVIAIFLGPGLVCSAGMLVEGAGLMTASLGLLLGPIVGGIVMGVTWPCHYTLTDTALQMKAGYFEETVPLRKIREITPVVSFLSAPCLSVKRVMIVTEDGREMVSPRDREAFIEDLKTRVNALRGAPAAVGRSDE